MKIWSIEGDNVKRHGAVIATIAEAEGAEGNPSGKFGWKWRGEESFYRVGFADRAKILEDVKYFHRHKPPRLTLTFKSGRKEVCR